MSRNYLLASVAFALLVLVSLIVWMEPLKPTKVTCLLEYYLPEEEKTPLEKKKELLNRFFIDKAPAEEHRDLDWLKTDRVVVAAVLGFKIPEGKKGFELEYFIEDSEGTLHRAIITDEWFTPHDALRQVETPTCEFGFESRLDYTQFIVYILFFSFGAWMFAVMVLFRTTST